MRLKVTLLLGLLGATTASRGDRSPAYHECVNACIQAAPERTLPLTLRLTRWTPESDCMYTCQQSLTDAALNGTVLGGLPPFQVVQFHGKWPFRRILGIQEPLSVIFSALNLWMHMRGRSRLQRELPTNLARPLKTAYRIYPYLAFFAWISSILFHTRDTPLTEKLDYFSAALSILWTLYIALLRFMHLSTRPTIRRLLLISLGGVYLAHISYLSLWKFDYAYNMLFNIVLGLMHNAIWFIWCGYHYLLSSPTASLYPTSAKRETKPSRERPPHIHLPLIVLTGFMAAMGLEIMDFPRVFP